MPEFDFHAAIKELAEVRIRCPQGSLSFKGESDQRWLCPHEAHGYTGYYEPFATLRVKCPIYHEGRGCTPEPDVEKACWRLTQMEKQIDSVDFTFQYRNEAWEWYNPATTITAMTGSAEEAVLRAALAWVIEQHGVFGGEERSHDFQLL